MSLGRFLGGVLLAALAGPALATGDLPGDAAKGEKVFGKCKACHQVGEGAKNRTGPVLNDIVGARVANIEGFRYSDAMRTAGADGMTWDTSSLDAFLENPRKNMPGTKMSFRGLGKPEDRANVIAYLAGFSDAEGMAETTGFTVPPEILALEGDAEYGEYLAGECTACHQASGGDGGIPSIVGLDRETFVTAMHAYRVGHREHPVMQMIAGRLADDEIAGLAAYFQSLAD